MKGSVRRTCACRDPETGRQYGTACPKLANKRHGRWEFVLEMPLVGGKRRQVRRRGFETKREAQDALDEVVSGLRRGVEVNDKTSLADWLEFWYAEKTKASGVSAAGKPLRPSTARMYRQHIDDYLTPQLGRIRLSRLAAGDIASAYDAIMRRPVRPQQPLQAATLRRVHATLRAALNIAVRARKIDSNPANFVTLPDAKRPQVVPWSPDELAAFLGQLEHEPLGCLFEVMAFTGLRRGEALGLRWSDVDLDAKTITVRQTLIEYGTKVEFGRPKTASGEERRVDLDDISVHALRVHQLAQREHQARKGAHYQDYDLVFAQSDGRPITPGSASATFRRIVRAVRFPDDAHLPDKERRRLRPVRLHDLRHGQASLMLAAGVPITVVSKRLGHSTLTITADTYSHLLEGVGQDAANRAAALVPRSNPGRRDTGTALSPPASTSQ